MLPVLVLGVVDIALTHRSVHRCLGFAGAVVAGPIGALAVSQIGVDRLSTDHLEATAPGVAMVVIAVVTCAVAWLFLGLRWPRRWSGTTDHPT